MFHPHLYAVDAGVGAAARHFREQHLVVQIQPDRFTGGHRNIGQQANVVAGNVLEIYRMLGLGPGENR